MAEWRNGSASDSSPLEIPEGWAFKSPLGQGFFFLTFPVDGSDTFVEFLKEKKGVYGLEEGRDVDEVLQYVRVPGDHGFDADMKIGDEKWIYKAVEFIERHWLQ